MKVVITGGIGFIGRRLAQRLLQRGTLIGPDGRETAIDELMLFDNVPAHPPLPPNNRLKVVAGDIADPATVRQLIDKSTGAVFHLAAVVSGQAEADTDIGYRVNLDGTRAVLETCRALGTVPRLVFASSLAVYGGDMPPAIADDTPLTPQTSYGTQKAIGELLVNDYSRKGYIDGRCLRLPTIVVRPGRPNRAASTWVSSLFREPLSGVEVVCPVSRESVMACLSPRRLVAAIERVHDLPAAGFGFSRTVLLPGISVTVSEMVEALRRAGGDAAVKRIRWEPDPVIQKIVDGWPRAIVAKRAQSLGIAGDADIDEIVQGFVEDDLPAQKQLAAMS
ncbi:MAG TPA: D-erythronate dehydrogenase [Stellaceae bacterium]|jgi:D-erythronate 2-dehydrogenase|nr:D-erythronate dehydrogenase [Stellaceae bacterium]